MIGCESVRDTCTAIVTGDQELAMTECSHDLDHIDGHRALRVIGVIECTFRLTAIAITTKVCTHHRKILGKCRRDLVPHAVVLWVSMQQQERGALTSSRDIDRRTASGNL